MTKQPCVYILAGGRAGTLYIGVTSDLIARLHHLVWFEQHDTMESAIMREKRLKKWNRDWKLNLIEASDPEWLDLAIGLGFEPGEQERQA